jgi:sugar lactone lactonase YvrE
VAVDGAGNVYVADFNNSLIRKITPAGVVTTLAGAAGQTGGADGKGAAARFNYPEGVALDKAGNLYVADTGNDAIRKITPSGVVTTLAGTAGQSGSADGTGAAARFTTPIGIGLDSAGNVYVTARNLRKITPSGVVTTLAGTLQRGSANGTGSAAQFSGPAGLVVDSAGNIYVADALNDEIRKVTPAGVVTTLAGTANQSGSADGTRAAAQFNAPCGIALDGAGNFYVADTNNDTIRRITAAGVVTTLAGTAGQGGSADGKGGAALFNGPFGLALDGAGNLYVGDTSNNTVRKGSLAPGPSISVQPKPATVTVGGTAIFTVSAIGSPAPKFEWQVSTNGGSTWAAVPTGGPYSGTDTDSLTISGATAAMSGYLYR